MAAAFGRHHTRFLDVRYGPSFARTAGCVRRRVASCVLGAYCVSQALVSQALVSQSLASQAFDVVGFITVCSAGVGVIQFARSHSQALPSEASAL